MIDIQGTLETLTAEQRQGAIIMLDLMTRPLTVREIENALRKKGVPKSRAVIMAIAVKDYHIVALIGGEQ